MFFRHGGVRAVRPGAVGKAREIALRDPVVNALAGSRLDELSDRPGTIGAEFSLAGEEGRPTGLLWHGVNISPLSASPEALTAFGRHLAARPRRSSSVVGERTAVRTLWEHMGPGWDGDVREYRWRQPLLVADGADDDRNGLGAVRAAVPGEESAVFPAAVAMFREEVGIDPTRGDGGRSYGRRVTDLIAAGRTYVVMDQDQVVFKADVGARFGDVAQVHGVWVDPARRHRGLGSSAMVDLVRLVRQDHAPRVSLYVNDFNEPARRAYAAAGFRQVGELSTILF